MANQVSKYYKINQPYSLEEIKSIADRKISTKYRLLLEGYQGLEQQEFVVDAVYEGAHFTDIPFEPKDFEREDGTCGRPNDGKMNYICVKNICDRIDYNLENYIICASSVPHVDN